jgi:hypothetical protein
MGICISYQGSLSDPSTLDEALREIRGFCRSARWRCEDFSEHYSGVTLTTQAQADGDPSAKKIRDDEPWPELPEGHYGIRGRVSKLHPPDLIEETVRGVMVAPPDTESLRLVFDQKGRLVHYMELPAELVINALPDTIHYVAFPHFVKTSGSAASHAGICELLHLLKRKFVKNLKVKDETSYWKTGDVESLKRQHAAMDSVLGTFRKSKDLGGLLRALGADIPGGEKIELLDPRIDDLPATKAKKKRRLN